MNNKLIKRLISETVKEVLSEAAPDQQQKQAPKFTSDQQREFFESIKKFNEHSPSIYRRTNIADSYKKIKAIVEFASQHLVEESGEWFDNVTSGRHSRRLKESFKVFEKTVSEVMKLQQRLESSYEDIGETLNKYYEIQESAMRQNVTENKSVAKKKSK
jgi:molybdopterin-biosynthesis enzyme MoeA-like protein